MHTTVRIRAGRHIVQGRHKRLDGAQVHAHLRSLRQAECPRARGEAAHQPNIVPAAGAVTEIVIDGGVKNTPVERGGARHEL